MGGVPDAFTITTGLEPLHLLVGFLTMHTVSQRHGQLHSVMPIDMNGHMMWVILWIILAQKSGALAAATFMAGSSLLKGLLSMLQ